jgi:glutamate-1-semialdehyde 2,1-aminomutase
MTAGLTTLELLREPGAYDAAVSATQELLAGLEERAAAAGIPLATNQAGTMMGIFFTEADSVAAFEDVAASDTERFKRFFHGMLAEGVYLAPSPFEAGFVSTVHDQAAIQHTLDAAERVFARI